MFVIKVNKERPDFRVLIDLFYDSERNVDTSGNCREVYDRNWTDFYLKDRESGDHSVTAWIPSEYWYEDEEGNEICTDYIFNVKSKGPVFEETLAIYLFLYCGESISNEEKELTKEDVEDLKEKHKTCIHKAESSVYHKSSKENPYPKEI
jgi:hypothetical protein